MSRSRLEELRQCVASATTADGNCLARVNYGIGLAQNGDVKEATEILQGLRAEYGSNLLPSSLIRIVLFEGVLDYYHARSKRSLDRVKRAFALAKAGGNQALLSECGVWLALLGYNFDDLVCLRDGIVGSLDGISLLDDSLAARAYLVLGDTNQYIGRHETASRCYSLARDRSRKNHDWATMVAIEYNRLATGLSRIRIEQVLGLVDSAMRQRQWLVEAKSVQRLHLGVGAGALMDLLELCNCRLCELQGDYRGAAEILQHIREIGAIERCGMSDLLLELESMWCRTKSNASNVVINPDLLRLDRIAELSLNDRFSALYFASEILVITSSNNDNEATMRMLGATKQEFLASLDHIAEIASLCDNQIDFLYKLLIC